MTAAAIAGALDPGSVLNAAQGFMSYGPSGLAGLLIVLVIATVMLRKVDEAGERILKLIIYESLASDSGGCPGGGGGIPIPHGAQMTGLSSGVRETITSATANLKSVINSLPAKN